MTEEVVEDPSWTVVKKKKKEPKKEKRRAPRNRAPREKNNREGERSRSRRDRRGGNKNRERGENRGRTQQNGNSPRRAQNNVNSTQPIGTASIQKTRNVPIRSNTFTSGQQMNYAASLQKSAPISNQWTTPPVVQNDPIQQNTERPVSRPPSGPPSITPEPVMLNSNEPQHELNSSSDNSVVMQQNQKQQHKQQPKPIGPPSKSSAPATNNNTTNSYAEISSSTMGVDSNTTSSDGGNVSLASPTESVATNTTSSNLTPNVLHSSTSPYKNNNKNQNTNNENNTHNKNLSNNNNSNSNNNNEISNSSNIVEKKTEIYNDYTESADVIRAPIIATGTVIKKLYSVPDGLPPPSPTTFTWIGGAPKDPPKMELQDQLEAPLENDNVGEVVLHNNVEDIADSKDENTTTTNNENTTAGEGVVEEGDNETKQQQSEIENPSSENVNNNGQNPAGMNATGDMNVNEMNMQDGQNNWYHTRNPYIDTMGQPITFDENQWRGQNVYPQFVHPTQPQMRQHFPTMMPHYIQGTPGMMQNPVAPGLPTKMYNHPHGAPHPYQHANNVFFQPYQPHMQYVNQLVQSNRNNQNENKSQSKNLTHFNSPPIIDAYQPTQQYFIQPTHRPQNTKGQILLNQLVNPQPRLTNFEDLFSCPDVFHHYSPVSIIAQFLTFNELMNNFLVVSKRIHECGKYLPLLETLTVHSLHMFNLNNHLTSWKKFLLLENESPARFFSSWSSKGLQHVKICEKETSYEETEFNNLVDWLEKAENIETITIEGDTEENTLLHDHENNNLKKLLSRVDCKHLLIENLSFELNTSVLNALKKNKLTELTVTSEHIQWDLNMISQLPSGLEGLTICRPNYSLLSVSDKLPSYLKRIYIQNVQSSDSLIDVEVLALFKKVEHVQLDFSSLTLFPKPLENVTTHVKRLDLFYDHSEKETNYEQIFQNLPFSLRHLNLTYTGATTSEPPTQKSHARNMLEGWWSFISKSCRESLEIIELHNSDDNGLNDLVTMFRSIHFLSLRKFVFSSNCPDSTVREKLQDIVPAHTELVVECRAN